MFLYKKLMKKNTASIPITLNVKATFPHSIKGIFISKKAKIGKNCVIFQQTTVGSNMLVQTKHRGAPTIGNNVYIGAGAKIIGNVKVGNGVRIGANAIVYENIPDNATVVSMPMRIIFHDYTPDNSFIDISYLNEVNNEDLP